MRNDHYLDVNAFRYQATMRQEYISVLGNEVYI
jgi:hypothetical protein